MAQTTRTHARMCLLGVSVTLLPVLGWNFPKNPNIGGVNSRFQAKRAKYWKFHVIETTDSISTKFCTTIETIKWSSRVVPIGAQQIKDGWRPPFWKKSVKSPYLCNRLTDFDEIWYIDAYWPPTVDLQSKFRIFEKQDGVGRYLEKSQKSRYLRNGLTDFYKSWYADAKWVPYPLRIKNSNFTNPRWKPLNRHISATVWPILMIFGMMTYIGPYSGSTVKISNFWKVRWWWPPSWKSQKSPQRFDRSLRNLVRWWKWVSHPLQSLKYLNFTRPRWRTAAILKTVTSLLPFDWFFK